MVRTYLRKTESVDIQQLELAIRAVEKKELSIRGASKKFRVAFSTLRRRLNRTTAEQADADESVFRCHGGLTVLLVSIFVLKVFMSI